MDISAFITFLAVMGGLVCITIAAISDDGFRAVQGAFICAIIFLLSMCSTINDNEREFDRKCIEKGGVPRHPKYERLCIDPKMLIDVDKK